MKKQLSLIVVLSACISQFSAFGQQAPSPDTLQLQIDEINANYAKQMQLLQEEKTRKLQELRQQYEQALKLIDAQLAEANQAIVDEFRPQFAQADASQAASLREKINRQKEQVMKQYEDAVAELKRAYTNTVDEIKEKSAAAERSLKNQLTTFKRGVKQTGQAAVNAAIASLSNFGMTMTDVLNGSIVRGIRKFKLARKNFKNEIRKNQRLARRLSYRIPEVFGQKLSAIQQAVANRWGTINAGLKEGKERLIKEITMLKEQIDQLKNRIEVIGTGALSEQDHKELMKLTAQLGLNLAALTVFGNIPVISYQIASRPAIAQKMYETGKRKLMGPIQKMAASYRAFKAQLNCLGNPRCTVEQRRQAINLFLKLYSAVVGVTTLALFGTTLAAALLDARQEAQREGRQQQLPTEKVPLGAQLEARRLAAQPRRLPTQRMLQPPPMPIPKTFEKTEPETLPVQMPSPRPIPTGVLQPGGPLREVIEEYGKVIKELGGGQ